MKRQPTDTMECITFPGNQNHNCMWSSQGHPLDSLIRSGSPLNTQL